MRVEVVAATEAQEMTVAEAAVFASVSDRTIRNWINEGSLAAINTPSGRKVRKDAVVGVLREKGYAPPELVTPDILPDTGPPEIVQLRRVTELPPQPQDEVAQSRPAQEAPPQSQEAPSPNSVLTPQMINVVLQPLVQQLDAANERAEKKERENLELAGRIGYLQAKVQQYEERVLLLEAPRDTPQASPDALPITQPPVAALSPTPESDPVRVPWYKRLFGSE